MKPRVEIALFAVVICCLISGGCASQKPTGLPSDKMEELKAFQDKRESHAQQLHAMDVKQLTQELATDSEKGRAPFNSPAYREAVSRGESAATDLKQSLTHPEPSALLALLALRKVSPTQYQSLDPAFRVNVLVSALQKSKYFNTWGIPCVYWEDGAKAIVEEGGATESALLGLLRDQRPAPAFGSEGATVDAQFHYRVGDYAFALLSEIRHQKCEPVTKPADRDSLIEQMLKTKPESKRK